MRLCRSFPILVTLAVLAGCEFMQTTTTPAPRSEAPAKGKPARTPVAGGSIPLIVLSETDARPGQVVRVTATLQTAGQTIAGTQNDIGFDPRQLVIKGSNNQPDCSANPAIRKEGTAFSFQPSRCKTGLSSSCNGVRALVLSLGNVDPIPNGSVLYSCNVQLSPQASPGRHALVMSRVGFSDPKGGAIDGKGVNGVVAVGYNP
jgi:hypothetical protein